MDLFQIVERVLDKKPKSEEELKQKYKGRVPEEHIDKQLKLGIEVELEHTSDRKAAEEIARSFGRRSKLLYQT